jgi:succinate dehydrogenase / fumarate reductase cytochrome b subunit
MNTFLTLYNSSIGKKLLVGLTGLLLCLFLVVHLGGNLLLYRGDGGWAFDKYAEALPSFLLIRIAEIGLFAIFLFHIFTTSLLWFMNKRARPVNYAVNKPQENSSLFSRTMFLSGSIVFIFLVIHMRTFWFTSRFHAEENPSMYQSVVTAFSSPVYGDRKSVV